MCVRHSNVHVSVLCNLCLAQREGVTIAVVEHVFAGGRVKAFIPRQNCEVMFAISAVKCPTVEKAASRGPDGKLRPVRPS